MNIPARLLSSSICRQLCEQHVIYDSNQADPAVDGAPGIPETASGKTLTSLASAFDNNQEGMLSRKLPPVGWSVDEHKFSTRPVVKGMTTQADRL